MSQTIVVIEAFNDEAKKIRRGHLIDFDGIVALAETNNISLKIGREKNGSYKVEVPYSDFADVIQQQNVAPELVTAFRQAEILHKSNPVQATAPQKLAKNPDVQVSIIP